MQSRILKASRNIFIGFITLVFIMGFFSKSIINLFLPKVMVQEAKPKKISRNIDINGIVGAEGTIEVKLGSAVRIKEYFLKPGAEVDTGDPIFRVDKGFGLQGQEQLRELTLQLEKEQYRLSTLQGKTFIREKSDIDDINERLQRARKELLESEEALKAGIKTIDEVYSIRNEIKNLEEALEDSTRNLTAIQKQNEFDIKEAGLNIQGLNKNIEAYKNQQKLYSKIDEEGIYHSEVNGILLSIGSTDKALPQDTMLAEIAVIDEEHKFVFNTNIDDEDYSIIKSVGAISFYDSKHKEIGKAKVTDISRVMTNNMLMLTADIDGDITKDLRIGQNLRGQVSMNYNEEGLLTVPKAAVLTSNNFEEGSKGTVYVVEVKDGILGKEYIAKAIEVTIQYAGDNDIAVSGLEDIEKPSVIINLSYKIQDNVKVFLWE